MRFLRARHLGIFFFLYCSLLTSGGFGLCAKTSDVHFGASVLVEQPVGEFGNFARSPFSPARFYTGAGVQVSAMMPIVHGAFLRTSVSFAHFGGRARTREGESAHIECNATTLECDILYFFSPARERIGMYFISGASVDSIRYDIVDSRARTPAFDAERITDNALNIGVGHSALSDNLRFTVELVFHKTVVHDTDVGKNLPRMDQVRLSYGIVF